MGVCACTAQAIRVTPSIPRSTISERQKLSLATRLVEIRRLEEAPALAIAKSKLYQLRKKFKNELVSEETLGSGEFKSSGSLGEVANA